MILLTYAETSEGTIAGNIGRSEYSYYFVLRAFRPLLKKIGHVVEVECPEREVDAHWNAAKRNGEDCLFLCFNPPHKIPLGLRCPTVPIFAWEFDTIPNETWDDDPRHDWTAVLRTLGHAIVHSQHTRASIEHALGKRFPVVSIPAPVWESHARRRVSSITRQAALHFKTPVIDSHSLCLDGFERSRPLVERIALAEAASERQQETRTVKLTGVVYTSVLNPFDGRKRVWDMIAHFIWALRDRPDATLLLKTSHPSMFRVMAELTTELVELRPFRCRIVIVNGYVDQETYDAMLQATTYIVNCSTGEGQCLPLMEFMSCGKPAIAPRHTAMADYIDESNAFIVSGHPEPTIWPHDEREMVRATRMRIDCMSLVRAYQDSFVVARTDPVRYSAMSERAVESLRAHCSDEVTVSRLSAFLPACLPGQPEVALDRVLAR